MMPDLIGVNGDRAAETSAPAAFVSPWWDRSRIPASPPGSSSDRACRAGFQMGPGSPSRSRSAGDRASPFHRALDPRRRLRRSRDATRRGRARRRRSDSRGRHGRPLRAEHHHRPAGREGDQRRAPRCRSTST